MWDILNFILNLLSHPFLVGLLLGAAAGAWFYRFMLKRNPAKLEQWAADAKRVGDLAKSKVEDLTAKK
jgi:hypothetical protein